MSSGSRVVTCGQTDRHDEAFRSFANTLKNSSFLRVTQRQIRTNAHTHIYTHTRTHILSHACIHTNMHTYAYIYMYA